MYPRMPGCRRSSSARNTLVYTEGDPAAFVAELYSRCAARGLLAVAPQKVATNPTQTREPEISYRTQARIANWKQSDPLLASNLLASAEEYFQDTIRIAQRVTYRDDPKWTLVLAEAYNRIGLIHKTRGEQSKDPERASQLAMARGGFALAREIYKRLLAREPNNKIALARLVLTTANQVLVAERLGDRKVLGDDIVPLLEDRIKYSRRLFEMDRSNPYFAALLSTGLMIRAEQIVALTGDNDNEVLNTQKPLCRGAWRLAEEALEITQRNLRKDLFSTFRRICLKLGYREELARMDQIEGTPKSTEPLPGSLQSAGPRLLFVK